MGQAVPGLPRDATRPLTPTADRELVLAPSWLQLGIRLVFIPVPFVVFIFVFLVYKNSIPDATALHVAAWLGQPKIVRLLRGHYDANVHIADRGGRTPLDITTNQVVLKELTYLTE